MVKVEEKKVLHALGPNEKIAYNETLRRFPTQMDMKTDTPYR